MVNWIKIIRYKDADVAQFETRLHSNDEDNNRRVKHYVFKKDDAYIHVWKFLSSSAEPLEGDDTVYVSERKFWNKVRLVSCYEVFRAETWIAIGQAVEKLESLTGK